MGVPSGQRKAFTMTVTADDGFLTGNSWDGKIWKMQGQMPGKSRIPVGAKEGDGSEFIFSENPQEKGMLYEGWCMFETKRGGDPSDRDGGSLRQCA